MSAVCAAYNVRQVMVACCIAEAGQEMDALVTTPPGRESRLVTLARRAGRLPALWLTIVVGIAMVILGAPIFGLRVFLAVLILTGQLPHTWGETFADSAVLSGLHQTGALVISFSGVLLLSIGVLLIGRRRATPEAVTNGA